MSAKSDFARLWNISIEMFVGIWCVSIFCPLIRLQNILDRKVNACDSMNYTGFIESFIKCRLNWSSSGESLPILMMQQCTLITVDSTALRAMHPVNTYSVQYQCITWISIFGISKYQTHYAWPFKRMPSAHDQFKYFSALVFLVWIQCKNNISVENNQNENISQHQRVMQLIEYAMRWVLIFVTFDALPFCRELFILLYRHNFIYFWLPILFSTTHKDQKSANVPSLLKLVIDHIYNERYCRCWTYDYFNRNDNSYRNLNK